MMTRNFPDRVLGPLDLALRTVFAPARASRPCPTVPDRATELTPEQRRASAALMRVNHVGEVCAQALYAAQAASTGDPALRRHFQDAAQEETDHLAWTQERLRDLGGRPSLFNPLWYAGAWTLGFAAGRLGDAASLGFVVETERQVEAHLASHLERLPADDHASRAIVSQMQAEEAAHAADALEAGAIELPGAVKVAMRAAARVMTTTAHYI